ncbi:MAG: glycosyltransferase family 39 protein [Alphaproteobacteria bacterium]|nr:glycosyltransferase family 39 protein [Alphaproteobacteria bacterium]
MSSNEMSGPARNWFLAGVLSVLAITLFRVGFLLIDKTDLFVDESQYWLWSRDLDFGYYSKPPLIAWVIRLATELAQSNAIFWVRLPAPLFHLATAVILGLLGRNLFGAKTAFWVMLSYISMPAVTLGSAVISTDTIMAPFFSLALLFYFRLLDQGRASDAVLTGVMVGVAFLAKYAGIYFLVCAALAAIFVRSARPSGRNWFLILLAFFALAMPNLIWNLINDLTTFEHTMDNAAWVRESGSGFRLKYLKFAEFFFSQFGVFGPILFATLLACVFRSTSRYARILVFLSVPIILIVCVQALLSKAYANWAVAAYFGGTVLAVSALVDRHIYLLKISVAIGMAAAIALPILTSVAYDVSIDGEKPALKRLLGREKMSREILQAADSLEADVIVARSRDILADLFYTGRHADVRIRSVKPGGRPGNYYQLKFPFESGDTSERVLLVSHRPDVVCGEDAMTPNTEIATKGGALHGSSLYVYLVKPACIDDSTKF